MQDSYRYVTKDIDSGSRIDEVLPKLADFPTDAIQLIEKGEYNIYINSKDEKSLQFILSEGDTIDLIKSNLPPPVNDTHQQKPRAMYDKIQKLLSEKGIKREPPHVVPPPPSSSSTLMSPSTPSPFELDPTIPYTPHYESDTDLDAFAFPISHSLEGPFYSIDVECVATGYCHMDRAVGHIAIVDENCDIIYNQYIKPEVKVVNYLTPLNGLTEELLSNGIPLSESMKQIRELLPSNCVIVGQSVWHDILWLGLERGTDYKTHIDIQRFFSAPLQQMIDINPFYKGKSSYIVFSLRHEVKYLCNIDIQEGQHDPAKDALYSMKLFLTYRHSTNKEMKEIRELLCRAPRSYSFASLHPCYEGIEMRCSLNCDKRCQRLPLEIVEL